MEKNNHISALWPTLIGEFYNPEHEKIKNDLLIYFEDYIKIMHLGKVEKITNFMKVDITSIHKVTNILQN